MRDNILVSALRAQGADTLLVPTYTPIRTDVHDVSERRVFYGGVGVYFSQRFPIWQRAPNFLRRLLSAPVLLRSLSRLAIKNRPEDLGDLTLSVLRGEHGHQGKELDELCHWLGTEIKPDLIHLTNSLFVGIAGALGSRLSIPVVCTLQGEDLFLEGLPAAQKAQALELMRDASKNVSIFVAVSHYYRDFMAGYVGIDRECIRVVHPGIRGDSYRMTAADGAAKQTITIGYLARICQEKGVGLLIDSFSRLKALPNTDHVRLRIAGYMGPEDGAEFERHLSSLDVRVRDAIDVVGEVDFDQKRRFLASCDLFCVPAVYREPKGMYVLEALSAGLPVVLPAHGAFPELVEASGGGVLVEPNSVDGFARALYDLAQDSGLRQELGARGVQSVEAYFNDRRMACETMEIYEEVLRGV